MGKICNTESRLCSPVLLSPAEERGGKIPSDFTISHKRFKKK